MNSPPVSSNGQLDAQIAQLTQCKPLPEHEVRAAPSFSLLKWMTLVWCFGVG